jgi:GNAT superfamily N-acetyltransferase
MVEFIRLDGKEAREIDPEGVQWPDGTLVLYAVEQGEIVGRQAYLLFPHLEGAWVREDQRGGTLAYRLVRETEKTVEDGGYPAVFAYVLDSQPDVADYMERMDYKKLPLTLWMKQFSTEDKGKDSP